MRILPALLLSTLLIAGCRDSGVIEEDKFVNIYSDLLVAGDTSSVAAAKKLVFKKYSVSEKEYSATINYYSSNPSEWDQFFTKVIAHIEQMKKKASSGT